MTRDCKVADEQQLREQVSNSRPPGAQLSRADGFVVVGAPPACSTCRRRQTLPTPFIVKCYAVTCSTYG